jgi:hypothetical protein
MGRNSVIESRFPSQMDPPATDISTQPFFWSARYEEVSLAGWLAHLPPDLLMQHLNLTREGAEEFPKDGQGVVPI